MTSLPKQAVIREVGLRDGLQSIQTVLPTPLKCEWVSAAYAAGQREIEVGSFVPARLLPQLADTAEVLAQLRTVPGAVDVGLSEQDPQNEMKIELDRRLANTLGISANDAAWPLLGVGLSARPPRRHRMEHDVGLGEPRRVAAEGGPAPRREPVA